MSQGILIGADSVQEWLLPWWWKYYSRHNNLPVTFIDFGMTPQSLIWCQKHGKVIPFDKNLTIAAKNEVDPENVKTWQRWYGENMWGWRKTCFNKPFAMALTPYEKTLWLDLDCEILQPIPPIFDSLDNAEFAIADPFQNSEFNSGVVAYKKNSLILKRWIELCEKENAKFCGDDYALTHLLNSDNFSFQLLHPRWNWVTKLGINFFVNIFHWSTEAGKCFIKYHNGIQDFVP